MFVPSSQLRQVTVDTSRGLSQSLAIWSSDLFTLDMALIRRVCKVEKAVDIPAVAAGSRSRSLRTILGEMSHLIATLALHAFGRARIWTIGSFMVRISTVTTREGITTRLGAVASTVAHSAAVHALDLDAFDNRALLLTASGRVAHLSTVVALGDLLVVGKSGVFETFKVLLHRTRPAFSQVSALRLRAVVEPNHVFTVEFPLQID